MIYVLKLVGEEGVKNILIDKNVIKRRNKNIP